MKIRLIYNENNNIEDMSKDRVHLNLSYQEYNKILRLIDESRLAGLIDEKQSHYTRKLARNIDLMFKHANKLDAIWTNKKGRVI